MLPGEAEFADRIADELAGDLQLGRALLSTCVSIITERNPKKPPSETEVVSYRIGNALCIKGCKTYRSILHLSAIGASHDADMLGRTLFETAVTILFVLRPHVNFGIAGFADDRLTSDMRARIYASFAPIQKYADFQRHSNDPRFAAVTAKVDRERLRAAAKEAEADIGVFWTSRLTKFPRTYSGFTLKELAAKLDPELSHWYEGMYGHQSKPIHAADAGAHVQYDLQEGRMMAKWHPSVRDVRSVLLAGGVLLWRCVAALDERFGFDDSPREQMTTKQELAIEIELLNEVQKKI